MTEVMQKEDFQAVFDHIYKIVEETVSKAEEVHPVVLGVHLDRAHCLQSVKAFNVDDLMGAPEGRAVIAQAMFALVERPDLDIVVHVSEAWYVAKSADSQLIGDLQISQDPDRKEGVMILMLSKDSEVLVVNPIHRTPSPWLERGELDFSQILHGRFAREPKTAH